MKWRIPREISVSASCLIRQPLVCWQSLLWGFFAALSCCIMLYWKKGFKGALCIVVEFRQCTGLETGPWLSGKHRMWVKNVPDQLVVVPQGWWSLLWNWLPQSCKTRDWSVTFNHMLTRHIPSLVGKNQLLEVSGNCKMKLVTKRYVA